MHSTIEAFIYDIQKRKEKKLLRVDISPVM